MSSAVSVARREAADRCTASMAADTSGLSPANLRAALATFLGVLRGDPPSRRDGAAGRCLADDDGGNAMAHDDGDRGRAASGEVFNRAFSIW